MSDAVATAVAGVEPAAPVSPIAPAAPAAVAPAPPAPPAAVAPAAPATPAAVAPAAPGPDDQRPAAPAAWLQALPAELQGNSTLAKYGSVEAMARAHLETKSALSAKALPAASDEIKGFEAFQVARPADPKDYAIPVPEGGDQRYADGFRGVAHEIGLHPAQAARLAQWNNQQLADALAADMEKGKADLASLADDMARQGQNYDAALQGVAEMLTGIGITDFETSVGALESKIGARPAMELLIKLGAAFAEPARTANGNQPIVRFGALPPDQAAAVFAQKKADPVWVKAAMVEGSAEAHEYAQLQAAMSVQRR